MPPSTIDTRALLARDDGYRLVNEIGASGAQDFAGKSVALADFNGDGYADILVGAYLDDVGEMDREASMSRWVARPERLTSISTDGHRYGRFPHCWRNGGDQAGFSSRLPATLTMTGLKTSSLEPPAMMRGVITRARPISSMGASDRPLPLILMRSPVALAGSNFRPRSQSGGRFKCRGCR